LALEIKAAVIDLYNNEPNEGIRCIKDILSESDRSNGIAKLDYKVFNTRYKDEIPDLNYDIYISSGGPGSPFDGEGTSWEKNYFNLIDSIWSYNQNNHDKKKYLFFICHSFQMMNRFFKLGKVSKRDKTSFGLLPFTKTEEGFSEKLFAPLPDPFYAADIRLYQVTEPDMSVMNELGAKILSYEIPVVADKKEKAMTAIRISDEIIGTQFHPEADPDSMLYHFRKDERKQQIADLFGPGKYEEMLGWLNDENKLRLTRKTILPGFLNRAIKELNFIYSDKPLI
jgi:homoserine O-succinyltransferase/O-acetyltransferase